MNNNKFQNYLRNFLDGKKKNMSTANKYMTVAGLTLANIFFIFPQMKKFYLELYSNKAEITHVVKIIYKKVLFRF